MVGRSRGRGRKRKGVDCREINRGKRKNERRREREW